MLIKWIFLPLFLALASATHGAINPEEFVRNAPEKVRIKVEAGFIDSGRDLSRVILMARVLEVEVSASGLNTGDTLLIVYSQDHAQYKRQSKAMDKKAKTGWVGPQVLSYPPALSVGSVVLAHLKYLEGGGASGATFQPVGYQYAFKIPQ